MSNGNKGRFLPGPDPRRHTFSRRERKKGYAAALAAAAQLRDSGQRYAWLWRLVRGWYRAQRRRD
jgi:hypothetical protein